MIFETQGIDWSVESEKSKWLRMPERRKRCCINGHRLLRKQDADCDKAFIAAGLITIVYKNFPEAENTKPFEVYEGILAKQYQIPIREIPENNQKVSDSKRGRYLQIIAKYHSNPLSYL